jgi:hypothetical protein
MAALSGVEAIPDNDAEMAPVAAVPAAEQLELDAEAAIHAEEATLGKDATTKYAKKAKDDRIVVKREGEMIGNSSITPG